MARQFVEASAQYLTNGNAVVQPGDRPFYFFAWFYADSFPTNNNTIFSVGDGSAAEFFRIYVTSAGGFRAQTADPSGQSAEATVSASTGQWHLGVGVFASSTDRRAYLDGGNKGTNTTSSTPTTLDKMGIGTLNDGSGPRLHWDGRIAEVGVVSGTPSDDLVASMYQGGIGIDHRLIDPQNMLAYWRLLENDGDVDYVGGFHMSPTNSPTYADHVPVVQYPGIRSVIQPFSGVAAPGSVVVADSAGIVQTVATAVRQTK